MAGTNNNIVSTQFDDETLEKINTICKKEDRTASYIVRRIVREYLKEHQDD